MMPRHLHRIAACLLAGFAMGVLAEDPTNAPAASVTTTNAPSADPATFVRLISERNIFNPDRRPRTGDSRRTERPRNTVVPTLTLVGTMDYEKGSFAFFDGPTGEYRKTISTGNSIAGYTLTAILPSSVRLRPKKGAPIELKIGVPLRLDDAAPIEVDPDAAAQSDAAKPADDTPPAAAGDAGDILRKLMQKRQQESK